MVKELDNKITERVNAEFEAEDLSINRDYIDDIVIPCSKELDMEWANESENIQTSFNSPLPTTNTHSTTPNKKRNKSSCICNIELDYCQLPLILPNF